MNAAGHGKQAAYVFVRGADLCLRGIHDGNAVDDEGIPRQQLGPGPKRGVAYLIHAPRLSDWFNR